MDSASLGLMISLLKQKVEIMIRGVSLAKDQKKHP